MIERVPSIRVLFLFFNFLSRSIADQLRPLRADLIGARLPTTFHGYLARTMLYAVAAFVLVLGGTVAAGLTLLGPERIESPQPLLLMGLVLPGLISSYVVYRIRLYLPRYIAEERAREIEVSMPNVTNFLLALSRAGVSPAKTLELIAENADILGPAGNEFKYAYLDMEYFGADVISALDNLTATTPSTDFAEFIEGYVRALTGRGEPTRYLDNEMRELFDEARINQEEFLASLGVLAEVYVAVFVAFPIFALITLVVMGFLGAGEVLTGIRAVVYLVIPLTAIGFLILLDVYMTNPLAQAGAYRYLETSNPYDETLYKIPLRVPDPTVDEESLIQTLDRYELRRSLEDFLRAPLGRLREQPIYALYLGLIVGVSYAFLRIGGAVLVPDAPFAVSIPADAATMDIVRAFDDPLVEALIFTMIIYSVFFELRARYLSGVERTLPDFLGELADRHQIGMALSESLEQLGARDMGALEVEIGRMRRDLQLRSMAGNVLRRFANRVRSGIVTRVVVLLVAAEETADRMTPVIDALAERAEITRQLQRERRVEMSLYVIIIYLAFLIFLVILSVLTNVLLPEVPSEGVSVGQIGGSQGFDQLEYETVFFHMSVIQGFFSGLVGGKMGQGTVSAGVKHALIMVILAYLLFTVVLPGITINV